MENRFYYFTCKAGTYGKTRARAVSEKTHPLSDLLVSGLKDKG